MYRFEYLAVSSKASSDLLGLSLFQSPTTSAASTPTGNHPYAPLTSPPLASASPSASPRYPGKSLYHTILSPLVQCYEATQPRPVQLCDGSCTIIDRKKRPSCNHRDIGALRLTTLARHKPIICLIPSEGRQPQRTDVQVVARCLR